MYAIEHAFAFTANMCLINIVEHSEMDITSPWKLNQGDFAVFHSQVNLKRRIEMACQSYHKIEMKSLFFLLKVTLMSF